MGDKTFELIEKMYNEFNKRFDMIEKDNKELKSDIKELKKDVRKTNAKIENGIIPKINALFDGYTQNTSQLDRIEKAVAKHEDIIIKKVK